LTYSLAACDLDAGQWGVATQSKFLAVGSVVPWAEAGVGAIATQAYANPRYGPNGLTLLREGLPAEDVVERLIAGDDGRDERQVGLVDQQGRAATYTGPACLDWAGGRTGHGWAAQGNILVSEDTVAALGAAFEASAGRPLAERLLDALAAAQAAGGDRRGQQSAAVIVERTGAAMESREALDRVVDLRVDDHPEPIMELRRLWGIQQRWDALRAASFHYRSLDYDAGIRILEEAAERFPDDATILYDLACYESLDGRREDAVGHVRRAIELEPGYREAAAVDQDFATLRHDDAFRAVVGIG
jgi:uncharacterized Ntn-hydrolase superfamily protein